jgi:short-subunit dehydrogenase
LSRGAKELRGDVALVTGAGSGIGREMSLLLAKVRKTPRYWSRSWANFGLL